MLLCLMRNSRIWTRVRAIRAEGSALKEFEICFVFLRPESLFYFNKFILLLKLFFVALKTQEIKDVITRGRSL